MFDVEPPWRQGNVELRPYPGPSRPLTTTTGKAMSVDTVAKDLHDTLFAPFDAFGTLDGDEAVTRMMTTDPTAGVVKDRDRGTYRQTVSKLRRSLGQSPNGCQIGQ